MKLEIVIDNVRKILVQWESFRDPTAQEAVIYQISQDAADLKLREP